MFSFFRDALATARGSAPTPFMVFFVYVWAVWVLKALAARRYRPFAGEAPPLSVTVLVPVFREPEAVFRRSLASVVAENPFELIAIVDGGDPAVAAVAAEYCTRVLRISKAGKRAAMAAGLAAACSSTEVVVVLDSDTVWAPGTLRELLRPFADPRVGGVTPRQAIFDVGDDPVRRLADWIEDLRYLVTVPAQSVFGQVGCLAGRTIAYRRSAFEPAVMTLVRQTVFGMPLSVGDDRVLTNELLRSGWRTVYQSTALVWTDAPGDWRTFWRQQLRWGRSSQRETVLSLRWLWKRPVAGATFATDILTPFALYAVVALGIAHVMSGGGGRHGQALGVELLLAFAGMVVSIGVRQIPHLRRRPRDVLRLPLFALQLTFVMVPIRILAFATMLHQSWSTRVLEPAYELPHEAVLAEPGHL
ncbi:glycosyltransferase [Solirubrobacter ginsenosidimutans]|uniref:Glycosyltransferase n=1 Tax=Solirubrobacter ginsenosidimutans TaxID=490573 RepID=A0A9X3RZ88_9ACTN|nr:glycosyltransferase [Solirubrobacter ginsenosidimutans]MDA0159914.1 glycosyltransferase [Solirubrobacter ginsenosidimutans]